ncbi:hypothetical protein [Rhodoferax sp.]|uniref:NACHT domain-containing protein n=1 Tax=Rhodoferax sp. TaxID=50421 RepID=UPI00262E4C35|nr:hypothetical protein [Rhodoferax sp.]MDD2924574.1 hypothetical protein [Rhodoferax sp.]
MSAYAVDPLARTCTELLPAEDNPSNPGSHPVITIRELVTIPVFVLLGEPGMGKSETMKALAALALGEHGKPMTVNDFIVLAMPMQNAKLPVFIDALDEARASGDTTVWKELRRSIAQSQLKRFGVACRAADWYATDAQDLATVAQGQRVRVFALNPLTPEQRHAVLEHEGVQDVSTFEQQAQTLGFGDMLGNPQSLLLLAAAVKTNHNQWPQTRREAYELACQKLVTESNQRHARAQQSAALLSDAVLLDAAGWLCALMLLSNQNEMADDTLSLNTLASLRLPEVLDALPANSFSANAIQQVLQRRLFTKPRGYTATHRTVAEYLAARHIAGRIAHGGLLVSRVSALMLASSQNLVSNLRGLAGWLAALSEPMRATIFEADPAAVLDYGDLHLLSPSAKQALIEQLAVNPRARSEGNLWQKAAAHVPLVQADMQDFVTAWLQSFRKIAHPTSQQSLVADVLLCALIHLPADTRWEPILLQLVRDENLSEGDRSIALQALYRHNSHHSVLTALLEDIHHGTLSEPRGRLTDSLLRHLYPEHIRPSQVLGFLKSTHLSGYQPGFPMFWGYYIPKQTPLNLLPELMEALERAVDANTFSQNGFAMASHQLEGLETLAVTAILTFGAEIEVAKLSSWLLMFFDNDTKTAPFRHLNAANIQRLNEWYRAHPNLIKQVMAHQVREGASSWTAQHHFPMDTLPRGMGAFWLEQAKALETNDEPVKAQDCLTTAFWWIDQKDSDITLNDLENAARHSHVLCAALEPLLSSSLSDDNWRRKHWLQDKKYRDTEADRHELNERNRRYLLDHLDDVRNGKLLSYLSEAAWADMKDSGYGGGPDGHLFDQWREKHPELDEATRQGYQTILTQLTSNQATSAVKSHKTSQILNIELPCLLAAQQLFTKNPQQLFDLGEERLKAVLTLFLLHHSSTHKWFLALAERQPDWVESVWWSLCESSLRSRKIIRIPQISLLRHEAALRPMALRLLPRILLKWPSKVREYDFPEFVQVLDLVLAQCAPAEVSHMLAERLKRKSLGSLQTGYLLMAGLWVDHPTFAPLLQSLLNKRQIEQTELLGFIAHLRRYGGTPEPLPGWDAATLGLLFRIFGPLCPSERPEGINTIGKKDEGRSFLHQLLAAMRNDTSEAAQQELQHLLTEPALNHWKHRLEETLSRQAQARAEKAFALPTPRQVALTLQNKTPANPADLMAVALDALHTLQQTLRNSDTNRLNRFWTVDAAGKHPQAPHRPEPECRNAIAEWLRADLKDFDISVAIENQHGAQNQSDIVLRVQTAAHQEMLLPIEIKGDWNRDLWTAATKQLAKQYASEPRCHHQGVYLVLWLGSNRGKAAKPKLHPNNPTNTPADLQACLQLETTQKTNNQNIRVFVLDISIPD